MKLQFKNVSGVAIAEAPNGLNLIAYCYGVQGGVTNIEVINGEDAMIMYTTLQDCGPDGLPVASKRLANEYTVNIPVKELVGIPIFSENESGVVGFSPEVIAIYVAQLVKQTNSVEKKEDSVEEPTKTTPDEPIEIVVP